MEKKSITDYSNSRDSYERIFEKGIVNKEQLFEFALSEIIYIDKDKADIVWEQLKDNIEDKTWPSEIFFRGFGRDSNGTSSYKIFYDNLFGKNRNFKKDPTNNAQPTKLLEEWTGYSKKEKAGCNLIRNYQVSHVFGRTKNVYCFTAPWNIVYLPKIIDPFTGHEAKGDYVDEFKKKFRQKIYNLFKSLIDNFNSTMKDLEPNINNTLEIIGYRKNIEKQEMERLKKSIKEEFSPIEVIS